MFLTHVGYALTCKVVPEQININLFYHGSKVIVTGETKTNDILIKISSPEVAEIFMEKRKVKGIFWMNINKFIFRHIPQVYFTFASNDSLDGNLNKMEKEKWGIGYNILKKYFEVPSIKNETQKDILFKELIKFKEKEHLWGRFERAIHIFQTGDKKTYKLVMDWSPNIPPNVYIVDVYSIKNGVVVEHVQRNIKVQKVGIVKNLSILAQIHGAIYGIVSIVVALGAGVITGIFFKKR